MNPNKIKLRNLDDEVLKYFHNVDRDITYDDLDEAIIEDIKNGVDATASYNDTELRNRIIKLENEKLNITDAEDDFYKKDSVYNKEETDELLDALDNKKLNTEDAAVTYLQIKDGVITENLLSDDLSDKVNARYENKRPPVGSEVSLSAFNKLQKQVNTNSGNISGLQDIITHDVLLKSEKITGENLSSEINNVISNARITTIPIEEEDLSEELRNKIDGGGGSGEAGASSSDIAMIKSNLIADKGQVLMGNSTNLSDGKIDLLPSFILLTDTIAIPLSSELEEAKAYAIEYEYAFVADLESNILYALGEDNKTWSQKETDTAINFLIGKFVLEYKTNDIYFGVSDEDVIKVVNLSDYLPLTGGTVNGNVTAKKFVTASGIEIY